MVTAAEIDILIKVKDDTQRVVQANIALIRQMEQAVRQLGPGFQQATATTNQFVSAGTKSDAVADAMKGVGKAVQPLPNQVKQATTAATEFSNKKGSIEGIGDAFGSVGKAAHGLLDVLGKIGLAKQGLDAITGAAKGLGEAFGVNLAVEAENVRARLLAFTKSGEQADAILKQIRSEADKTPFSFRAMADATASLLPVSKQTNVALMDLIKTSEILAALNPTEGLTGAAFALREALSGDWTSIVERFNLPRTAINKLKDEGVPAMQIVSKVMADMGVDFTLVSNLASTSSGKFSTFQDVIDGFRTQVGKPILAELVRQLDSLSKYLDQNKGRITLLAQEFGQNLAGGIRTLVSFIQDAMPHIRAFITGIEVWAEIIRGAVEAFNRLPGPVKAVTLAVGALTAALVLMSASSVIGGVFLLAGAFVYLAGRLKILNDEANTDKATFKSLADALAGPLAAASATYASALDRMKGAGASAAQQADFLKGEIIRLNTELRALAASGDITSEAYLNARGSFDAATKALEDLGVKTINISSAVGPQFVGNVNAMATSTKAVEQAAGTAIAKLIPFGGVLEEIRKKAKEGGDAFSLAAKQIDEMTGALTGAEQVLNRQSKALDAVASSVQAAFSSKTADDVKLFADRARDMAEATGLTGEPLERLKNLIAEVEKGGPGAAAAVEALTKEIEAQKKPIDDASKAHSDYRTVTGELAKEQLGLAGSMNKLEEAIKQFVQFFMLSMGQIPPAAEEMKTETLRAFLMNEEAAGRGQGAGANLARGILEKRAEVGQAAAAVTQEAWRNFQLETESLGLAMSQGIARGIAAGVNAVVNAVRSVFTAARNEANRQGGIEPKAFTLAANGESIDTTTESPEDTLARTLAEGTRFFDQFLPRMTNTPITPFGVPQTPINDNTNAILRNTDALMHVGAVFQETAGLSTSDAGGDGSGIRLQQRLNAGGLGGLTATDIHLREGADVTTFGIAAELLRASSQFGRLQSTMPGTPLWQALGFRSEATFKAWADQINASVQEQEQRRNPVNDALFAAVDALNNAGQSITDAATNLGSQASPALVDAAGQLGDAAGQLGAMGADIDRGAFDAFADAERERARREREGGGPAGTAPLPQAAGGARITRTGALVAHKDEVVLTPEQQARFLSPAGFEMARAKGWITEAAGIYGPPGMGGGGGGMVINVNVTDGTLAGMTPQQARSIAQQIANPLGQILAGPLEPTFGGRIG